MIVFYISGHGFGHASREIEIINAIRQRRPDLPIVVRTGAKRWIFDLTLRVAGDVPRAQAILPVGQASRLRLRLPTRRVRHGRRADRQPAPRRSRDRPSRRRVLPRLRGEGRPGTRGARLARRAARRRRRSAARVRGGPRRGPALHRDRQLHVGLDLRRLRAGRARLPGPGRPHSRRVRARRALSCACRCGAGSGWRPPRPRATCRWWPGGPSATRSRHGRRSASPAIGSWCCCRLGATASRASLPRPSTASATTSSRS